MGRLEYPVPNEVIYHKPYLNTGWFRPHVSIDILWWVPNHLLTNRVDERFSSWKLHAKIFQRCKILVIWYMSSLCPSSDAQFHISRQMCVYTWYWHIGPLHVTLSGQYWLAGLYTMCFYLWLSYLSITYISTKTNRLDLIPLTMLSLHFFCFAEF